MKTGVLRVGRAILNRIQDESQGLLIEEPDAVREFLGTNPQMALALEKASRLPLKAIWDLDSTAVRDVRIITTSYLKTSKLHLNINSQEIRMKLSPILGLELYRP
jgi:hypothetical protein